MRGIPYTIHNHIKYVDTMYMCIEKRYRSHFLKKYFSCASVATQTIFFFILLGWCRFHFVCLCVCSCIPVFIHLNSFLCNYTLYRHCLYFSCWLFFNGDVWCFIFGQIFQFIFCIFLHTLLIFFRKCNTNWTDDFNS